MIVTDNIVVHYLYRYILNDDDEMMMTLNVRITFNTCYTTVCKPKIAPMFFDSLFSRVPPGPYKSLKVLKFHTFKYKALKSP